VDPPQVSCGERVASATLRGKEMERDEALGLLKSRVKDKNLIKHSLAVEACMRGLARYFNEDEESWGLAGLLHDLDYEETKNDFSEEIIHAIKAHSGLLEPKNKMDIALYAVDALTGLIVAACLVHPKRDLTYLNGDFILRRFKEKRFAQGADREQIKTCSRLGLSLDQFIDLALGEMQKIHSKLGL